MESDRLPRKLAAILYADVAGYSRLTGEDEDTTHQRLREYLDLITDTIGGHRGRVVHYAGDAVLAEFGAVVDALSSATSIQTDLNTRNDDLPDDRKLQFRIGVNLGDVIEDRGDIYGDGVNIAARLESLADPGGICISDSVRSAVGKKLALGYEFMGEQQVKNITEPIRAYRVLLDEEAIKRAKKPKHRVRRSSTIAAAVVTVVAAGVLAWVASLMEPGKEAVSLEHPVTPQAALSPIKRGGATPKPTLIKAGRLNIKLALPPRWDAQVIIDETAVFTGSEFRIQTSPQTVMATDREGVAHFELLKMIKVVGSNKIEHAHEWMKNEGVKILLSRYAGGSYQEQRGVTALSTNGSGEGVTILSSVLSIGDERRNVKIAYLVRGKPGAREREFVIFFFHNKRRALEIGDDVVKLVTASATKIF